VGLLREVPLQEAVHVGARERLRLAVRLLWDRLAVPVSVRSGVRRGEPEPVPVKLAVEVGLWLGGDGVSVGDLRVPVLDTELRERLTVTVANDTVLETVGGESVAGVTEEAVLVSEWVALAMVRVRVKVGELVTLSVQVPRLGVPEPLGVSVSEPVRVIVKDLDSLSWTDMDGVGLPVKVNVLVGRKERL